METQPATTSKKNLVFTSAGDRSNLAYWLDGKRNFDLMVVYYGRHYGHHKDVADYYCQRKGSKFQNLHFVYSNFGELLNRYENVFTLDDDIIIDSQSINQLFSIRDQYDLWVLQPAFRPVGIISHPITLAHPFTLMRYTNFIEMTCPLFNQKKLAAFLQIYDPELVGYGVDWWFMHSLGSNLERRAAIVDRYSCINPHRGYPREIDLLQKRNDRKKGWERIKQKYHLVSAEYSHRTYGWEPLAISAKNLAHAMYAIEDIGRFCLKKIVRKRYLSLKKAVRHS